MAPAVSVWSVVVLVYACPDAGVVLQITFLVLPRTRNFNVKTNAQCVGHAVDGCVLQIRQERLIKPVFNCDTCKGGTTFLKVGGTLLRAKRAKNFVDPRI